MRLDQRLIESISWRFRKTLAFDQPQNVNGFSEDPSIKSLAILKSNDNLVYATGFRILMEQLQIVILQLGPFPRLNVKICAIRGGGFPDQCFEQAFEIWAFHGRQHGESLVAVILATGNELVEKKGVLAQARPAQNKSGWKARIIIFGITVVCFVGLAKKVLDMS